MKKIAISLGDINGVGAEIALKSHDIISRFCEPIYFINPDLMARAAKLLNLEMPKNMNFHSVYKDFEILPGQITKKSAKFSFKSFAKATKFVKNHEARAVVTLPINKDAWQKIGLNYKGHTDYLAKKFNKNAIMMLGCEDLFVGLYTDHMALKDVSKAIKFKPFLNFLLDFAKTTNFKRIGVLGFNPHASDNGVIGGDEEIIIKRAILKANQILGFRVFIGPLVPDASFMPRSLQNINRLVAIYHDQGLAPLKALYFDRAVNVSLNLPIIRTSVDHGTAFDIAYKNKANILSYLEATKMAIKLS